MIDWSKHRVAVLCGGLSAEREVSLRSGRNVHRALEEQGVPALLIDVGRDIAARLADYGPTAAYIALHGQYGEDGAVQGLLELMGIPYTGSGIQASAVCMDKVSTKRILDSEGIKTPGWQIFDAERPWSAGVFPVSGASPAVVKPVSEGSSIGVAIARDEQALAAAVAACMDKHGAVLVEEFMKGREVTTGVLGTGVDAEALPVLELVSHNEFYDYEAKYTPGMTDFILPARLDAAVYRQVQESAVRVHRLLGCRGVSRVDAIITEDNTVWTIEVNTSPGMTDTSDLPAQAAEAGIPFGDLVVLLLTDALKQPSE